MIHILLFIYFRLLSVFTMLSCMFATLSILPLLTLSAPSIQLSSSYASANLATRSEVERSATDMAQTLVMTYFVDWAPRSNMNYALFDYIDFAFALPDAEYKLIFDSPDAPSLLHKLVAEAHASSTFVKLSIGGWTGSQSVIPSLFLCVTNVFQLFLASRVHSRE